jgi:hypothetical protein
MLDIGKAQFKEARNVAIEGFRRPLEPPTSAPVAALTFTLEVHARICGLLE